MPMLCIDYLAVLGQKELDLCKVIFAGDLLHMLSYDKIYLSVLSLSGAIFDIESNAPGIRKFTGNFINSMNLKVWDLL